MNKEMVTSEQLRKNVLRARVQRFFAEYGQAVIEDPYGDDEELKVRVQPTECGVAFTVEYSLPGRALNRARRFLHYVSSHEQAFSAYLREFDQDAVFSHHLVCTLDDLDDATIAAAIDRLNAFFCRHALAIHFIEEEDNDEI